jgi:TetR/AcrR family transcriptional regulator
LATFGTRGFETTSLDVLAGEIGVRKQTILYYFPSKDVLLRAVVDDAAAQLVAELERTVARAPGGWMTVEAVVRKGFRLGARRPGLPGLLREVQRIGPPHSTRLWAGLAPLVSRARAFLAEEVEAGRFRPHDPDTVLFTAYWAVVGMATEVEAQQMLGGAPTLRALVRRREALISLMKPAIVLVDTAGYAGGGDISDSADMVSEPTHHPIAGSRFGELSR